VGAAYTWRKVTDVSSWFPRIGMTSADYTANAPVTQNGYTAQPSPQPGEDRRLQQRPHPHQPAGLQHGYNGLELTLVKRMSNKWFARGAFSLMDWHENVGPGPSRTRRATTPPGARRVRAQSRDSGPGVDGGQIAPRSGGSGKG
jgi:hypothetical protein